MSDLILVVPCNTMDMKVQEIKTKINELLERRDITTLGAYMTSMSDEEKNTLVLLYTSEPEMVTRVVNLIQWNIDTLANPNKTQRDAGTLPHIGNIPSSPLCHDGYLNK